jgi:Enoyl-(Acyl carrier protein) reductase
MSLFTPMAMDELNSPAGLRYRKMMEVSPSGRGGTPDEIGAAAAYLMGPDGAFMTCIDLLIDGGVIAAMRRPALAQLTLFSVKSITPTTAPRYPSSAWRVPRSCRRAVP